MILDRITESEPDEREGSDEPVVLVFSHLRYDSVFKRPQQVVSRLARRRRVLFVEEPTQVDRPPRLRFWQPMVNVQVCQPQMPIAQEGFHDGPMLRELLLPVIEGFERPVVWLYTPTALPFARSLNAHRLVYDCMHERMPTHEAAAAAGLDRQEQELLGCADLVFAASRGLADEKRRVAGNVLCVPNGVDFGRFAPRADRDDPWPGVPHPRLGCFGVFDERIDLGLIDHLARARPQWQLFMVGPNHALPAEALPRRPNIHWLGQHAFDSLPRMAASWDVCLLPFVASDATRHLDPAQALEYMAAGKPIVSTALNEVEQNYGDVIRIADDAPGFVAACDAALAEKEPDKAARITKMRTIAAWQDWDRVVATMEGAVFGPVAERASGRSYVESIAWPNTLTRLDPYSLSHESRTTQAPATGRRHG